MKAICSFFREEEGLTTVEYAVAGALISSAVILAFTGLGQQINTVINDLATSIT